MCRLVVLLCVVQLCVGSRVLVVFPSPSQRHTALGDALVKTLLGAGHEVIYVSPSSFRLQNARLTKINISSVTEVSERTRLTLLELVQNPYSAAKVMEIGTKFARHVLEHDGVQQLLRSPDIVFDLVIAEWFYTGLLAPLASIFNCPLIWYSTGDASWMNLQLVHGHTSPAYSVDPHARSMAAGFGVRERALRLWRQMYLTSWLYYTTCYVEAPIYDEVYRASFSARGRTLPDYEEVVYNASMLLINSHPLLGQPLPLPVNTKLIGGHHIEVPVKLLSQNLLQLLDRSSNGVIFFYLGSDVKSKDLPERMKKKLLDLFGYLDQTVVWQFDEALMGLPRNLHIFKSVPRTSILNHTNTVLFITQGDATSYIEATFFGIPTIGIPLTEDQYLNVNLAGARGRSLKVEFAGDFPYRLYDAIHNILGNNSYSENAQIASAIFQDSIVHPSKELLHWIDLVIQHGGEHLHSPAVQLSITQRLYLDLLSLPLMFLWFCSKVLKVIQAHWFSDDEVEEERKNQ